MKRTMKLLTFLAGVFALFVSCFNGSGKADAQTENRMVEDTVAAYSEVQDKANTFIVISKQELKLYVCEALDADTVRIVEYPVCLSRNLGQKERKGDMKTPECTWDKPFEITEIVNASKWTHDFGDGRGQILSYGNWFMRLKTPGFSGIGIHGSTNNESSVPGRDSEGCIRLNDSDLDVLKAEYAFKGMKVVVKREDEGLKPFEEKYY